MLDKRTPTPPNAVNFSPTTPPREIAKSDAAKLQSTPSNRGSASAAEYLRSVRYATVIYVYRYIYETGWIINHRVKDVSHGILADIRDHATCNVDALLNGLLWHCLTEEQKANPPADLLNQCLKAVLPICNQHDRPLSTTGKEKQSKEKDRDGILLREHLRN
jgi:hypothetical protein